jgi:hypothetical protein
VSPINLVFYHLLHVADRLPEPIHPQQPIQKACKLFFKVFKFYSLTINGSTGLKHNKRHTATTTTLSPHLRDVRRPGHNRGLQTTGETPKEGDPHGASFTCPHHASTDPPEPPHHRCPAHDNNGHPSPHPNGNDTTTSPTTHNAKQYGP